MSDSCLIRDRDLSERAVLFRYVSFESFVAFVESEHVVLSNINRWEDKREAILGKVPTVDESGAPNPPMHSFHESTFGQCWSSRPESYSDAMWRIYSPNKTGVCISANVSKFKLIRGARRLHLRRVKYFYSKEQLLQMSQECDPPFGEACLKRAAFEHEHEVRLLTNSQFIPEPDFSAKNIRLKVDPREFLQGVTLDPRAEDWLVEAIQSYCSRMSFPFVPEKSDLYESDLHLSLGIVRRWQVVSDESTAEENGA